MTDPHSADSADLTGHVLGGKYKVRRILGKGGFGTVYEGVDEMLGALVAIKVLNPNVASHDHAISQFLEEAKILTTLDHQNIVRWITFDKTESGLHYFVMENLQGEELSDLLFREGRLEPKRAVDILVQVLSALTAAHNLPDGSSLLHLDLKPQNVFVVKGDTDRIKVIDFGISQLVGAGAPTTQKALSGEIDVMQTMATMVVSGGGAVAGGDVVSGGNNAADEDEDDDADLTIPLQRPPTETPVQRAKGGTPIYASPEQCKHLMVEHGIVDLDERSDLYSLGIMAFQMLTGETPFGLPSTALECFEAHFEKQPGKLSDHGVKAPRQLAAFVDRCLEKDRDRRYATSREALAALESVYRKSAVWPKVVAALLFVAVMAMVYFWPEPTRFLIDAGVNDQVILGPKTLSRSIPMRDIEIDGSNAPARLVRDPASGTTVLDNWDTTVRAEGGNLYLDLQAPPNLPGLVEETVHVFVAGAHPEYSEELHVVYLGENAWAVRDVYVKGLGDGQALDPNDTRLLIHVAGRTDFFDENSIQVKLDETVKYAKPSTEPPPDEAGRVYDVALGSFPSLLAPMAGEKVFEVTVTDRAGGGGDEPKRKTFKIDSRKFTLRAELKDLKPTTEGYQIAKGSKTILKLTPNPNRKIAENWRLEVTKLGATERIEVTPEKTSEPDEWTLVFPPPGPEGRYVATVKITANDAGVLHASGPQEATADFNVQYNTAELTVGMKLDGQNWDDADRTYYTKHDRLKLFLDRGTVRSEFDLNVGAGQPIDLGNRTVRIDEAENREIEIPLNADGEYRISIEGFRLISATARAGESEWQRTITIVRDSKPPIATLDCVPNLVLDREGKLAWAPVLSLRDEDEAKAKLVWTLAGPAALEKKGECEQRGKLGLEALDLEPTKLADGAYTLTLRGTDAAGNEVQWNVGGQDTQDEMVYTWHVARVGPALTYARPAEKWKPRSGNTFPIVLSAKDPNGVKSVQCRIKAEGGDKALELGPIPLTREKSADGKVASAMDAEWTGSVDLPAGFSGKHVTLTFAARDAHANPAEHAARSVLVDDFEVSRPEFVRVRPKGVKGALVTKMIYLEGVKSYGFTGRDRDTEATTFQEYGYKRQEVPSKLKSEAPKEVKDFYLDETEVTVAQFVAFVRDRGYADGQHWTIAPKQRPRRSAEQLNTDMKRTYKLSDAGLTRSELPIVAVDFYECAAFASWAGKRLPTWAEFEYTIRGGTEYRPFSIAKRGKRTTPTPEDFNVRSAKGIEQLWTVQKGIDKTPEGIFDLCSNVGEWVAPIQKDRFGIMARSVGATFSDDTFFFDKSAPDAPDKRASYLGFRCAMDAPDMDAVRDGKHPKLEELNDGK